MTLKKTGFWTGGAKSYISAQCEEEFQNIDLLKVKLEAEKDPDKRKTLKHQIKELKKAIEEKKKEADSSLFMMK